MPVIRGASLAAHAAARKAKAGHNDAACYAARAAGQAVATAHVPTHGIGPALYAVKAVAATKPIDVRAAIVRERHWELQHLPKHLHWWVNKWIAAKESRLRSPVKIYDADNGE